MFANDIIAMAWLIIFGGPFILTAALLTELAREIIKGE